MKTTTFLMTMLDLVITTLLLVFVFPRTLVDWMPTPGSRHPVNRTDECFLLVPIILVCSITLTNAVILVLSMCPKYQENFNVQISANAKNLRPFCHECWSRLIARNLAIRLELVLEQSLGIYLVQ